MGGVSAVLVLSCLLGWVLGCRKPARCLVLSGTHPCWSWMDGRVCCGVVFDHVSLRHVWRTSCT